MPSIAGGCYGVVCGNLIDNSSTIDVVERAMTKQLTSYPPDCAGDCLMASSSLSGVIYHVPVC